MYPKAPPVIGRDWLTTPPVEKRQLRGRVTMIVFWSLGCEASLARVRELTERIEHLRPTPSVISVHTPRFAFAEDRALVEAALSREPLLGDLMTVHDPDLLTWARYSPGGWPAIVLIDHRGRALGATLGLDDLGALLEAAELANLRAERKIVSGAVVPVPLPAPILPSAREKHSAALSWPSSVTLIDDTHIAIADRGSGSSCDESGSSGRVLLLELASDLKSAGVVATINDLRGVRRLCPFDGGLAASCPDDARVVLIDLEEPQAEPTVMADRLGRPQGMTVDRDGSLVVCDAGDNQLVRILPDNGGCGVIAGTGFTGLTDGPAAQAELAQPVDIVRTEKGLVFLDAASSNIRVLTDKGRVRTVTDNGFNDFGLTDGPLHRASLQRPTGLASLGDGSLVIADCGNHRIRMAEKRRLRTLGLTGLQAPEALAALGTNHLLVCDTANHRVLVADLESQEAWRLELEGLLPPAALVESDDLGERDSTVRVSFPAVGNGPWTVTVRSEPPDLMEPFSVERSNRTDDVVVPLTPTDSGQLVVESQGLHPSEAVWQQFKIGDSDAQVDEGEPPA